MTGTEKPLRIALLDLYEGAENQGMRGIRQIIAEFATDYGQTIELKEFEVRVRQELPDATFDIYISSGGPGSPIDSKHEAWDQKWMKWLYEMETYNANPLHTQKNTFSSFATLSNWPAGITVLPTWCGVYLHLLVFSLSIC